MDPSGPPPRAGRLSHRTVEGNADSRPASRPSVPVPAPHWVEDTASDGSPSLAPDTLPIGAVSPFAVWPVENTCADGTPIAFTGAAPRDENESFEAPASPRSFLNDAEQTVQVPMSLEESALSDAPATLPLGTQSPFAAAPASFAPVPAMPPSPSMPATLPLPQGVSTALPPRAVAWGQAPTGFAPTQVPTTRVTSTVSHAWIAAALALAGLMVLVTLAYAVATSSR